VLLTDFAQKMRAAEGLSPSEAIRKAAWIRVRPVVMTALAALFALPNLLPSGVLDKLPAWYQQSRINLGLDLRGGAHFLLEVDLRSVLNERLTNLSDSARGELRKQQIGFKDVTVQNGTAVEVVLRDASQRSKAVEANHMQCRGSAWSSSRVIQGRRARCSTQALRA